MKNLIRAKVLSLVLLCLVSRPMSTRAAEASLDRERLDLEMRMQTRVEEALSKILSPGQFVVVVRVEPMQKIAAAEDSNSSQDAFYLPGVPAITKFDGSAEAINKLSKKIQSDGGFQRFIRQIAVTLVLDKDLSDEVVSKVRDLTRQMLGLDPTRGDVLDIQRTVFHKPTAVLLENTGFSRLQDKLKTYSLLIMLSLVIFCILIFMLFVFGPLRGFLNRLVQILPTLKANDPRPRFGDESQILPALMAAQSLGNPGAPPSLGMSPASFSGSLQVENPNKRSLPFGFIREDHISNLAILLSRESPEKAAVVLGYLPTEWLTRILAKVDPAMQVEITNSLATTRQLLPEQVEDIEQDLRRRLDYMIGGPDRIAALYEGLDPEAQRRMLESLKSTRPDIADQLRQHTFLFEDLEKLEASALKAVLREVDLQTLVTSLRGMPAEFVTRLLEFLPEGKAEIVREELELTEGKPGGKSTQEAQKKIVLLARRLDKEGQIQIPQVDPVPETRYGNLRSTLKLPPGLRLKESDAVPAEEGEVIEPKGESIQDRIRQFMNRRTGEKGRFPGNQPPKSGPGSERQG